MCELRKKPIWKIVSVMAICCFSVTCVFTQSIFDTFEKKNIVRNNIRSKTLWVYDNMSGADGKGYKSLEVTYNDKGQLLEEVSYRSSGQITYKRTYKYDQNGNRIEYQNYDGSRSKITYKKLMKYDATGNKIRELGFDGVDKFDNTFTYNSSGKLIKIEYHVSDKLVEKREISYSGNAEVYKIMDKNGNVTGKLEKKYDPRGNLIEDIVLSAQGAEKRKTLYKYNAAGNVEEEAKYYSGNLTSKMKYNYDNKNRLISVEIEEPGSASITNNIYSYDSMGRLAEEKWYDKTSKKYSKKSYKYDSNGNFSEVDCFYAAYNFGELYKLQYNSF